ncbi:MAG TPA: oligosaccharide flippase family protein [Solirubrobacterales bacterium]|nr:oligosaccharide flippase family protein [Solirubrobacterales bacterium]
MDRSVAQTLVAGVILQVVVMVSGVLAARMLGPIDRGSLALFWTLALVIVQVVMLGLPLAVTFELAKNQWSLGQLWSAIRRRSLAMAVGATVLQTLLVLIIFRGDDQAAGPALLSTVALPALVVQIFGVAVLQGRQQFTSMNIARLLPFVAYSVVLILGLLLGADSLFFVTSAWVGTYALAAAVTLILVLWPPAPDHDPPPGQPDLSEMTRFGVKGFLGASSPTDTFRADQLVVGLVLAPFSLGLYVAALALTNLPRFLALSVGLIGYPRIAAARGHSNVRREIWKYTILATLVSVAVAAPIALVADPALRFFFGAEFRSADLTVQLLLIGSPFIAARRVLGDGLRGADHPEAGTIAEVVAWICLIPLLFIGAAVWGIEGVALALSTSYLISWLAILVVATKLGYGFRRRT